MQIAHFGTFDVANYGDLLFPLIVEQRLAAAGCRFVHVSPVGGAPIWGDCLETVPSELMLEGHCNVDAVLTGGGHLLHASPSHLSDYQRGGLSALIAYPGLWLGAAHLAARLDVPACWNAPGVPQTFSPGAARLIQWTADVVDYLSVRDARSGELLKRAGCRASVSVVPDTALEVSRLWSHEQIDEAYRGAFAQRGRAVAQRTVAIHVNQRYVEEDLATVAGRLDHIGRVWDALPILIALGPCHGDDDTARRVARLMTSDPLLVDVPRSLREVAACIGRSQAYFGSSLHGMITACSFGRPGVLVARESAEEGQKFSGFLEQFGLSPWLAGSWKEADGLAERLRGTPAGAWRNVLQTATARLDRHWEQLEQALTSGCARNDKDANGHDHHKKSSLLRFDRLCRDHFAGEGLYQGVLFEQAARVGDALEAAERSGLKLHELRTAHARMKDEWRAELDARKAAAARREDALHDQLATERDACRNAQLDTETLARWIEDLESGVAALLASRRWRAGDLLGKAWSRATGRPQVAMVTDLFEDVFRQFQEWTAGNDEIDRPNSLLKKSGATAGLPSSALISVANTAGQASSGPHFGGERPFQQAAKGTNGGHVDGVVPTQTRRQDEITADVIICVHNALQDVRACLKSVLDCTDERHRLIIIDDGSQKNCQQLLTAIAARRPQTILIRNERPRGYTRSANIGLSLESSDYAVLLNSDTVVTPGWLERLIECGQSAPNVGIVGPLSNAASWQSVPRRFDADGDWVVNALPPGCRPADADRAVADSSARVFPRVALLNGFCLAIKRAVIDAVGLLDEVNFAHGYGEENDFCLRAAAARFELAVADHVYVHHGKSRSYSHRRRRTLTRQGQHALRRKHGDALLDRALRQQRHNPGLTAARHAAARALAGLATGFTLGLSSSASSDLSHNVLSATRKSRSDDSIKPGAQALGIETFKPPQSPAGAASTLAPNDVAPPGLGGDGSLGVPGAYAPGYTMSPVPGLESPGAPAGLPSSADQQSEDDLPGATAGLSGSAAMDECSASRETVRPGIPAILFLLPVRGGGGGAHSVVQEARGMRRLGVDVQIAVDVKYRPDFRRNYPEIAPDEELFFFYSSLDELTARAGRFDVVAATVYFSVKLLQSIVAAHPHVLPAYYVQDYEPRFFRKFSRRWQQARASYGLVPGMLHFAKTDWIRETVRSRHGIEMAKVEPSLDQEVFFPAFSPVVARQVVRVAAMTRPSTPYRGAARTMRVLRRLKEEFDRTVELHIFGCSTEEIESSGLARDFDFVQHGVLTRHDVADVLRGSDVFLDLSDYQAFGRTGLEAMACSTAVALPRDGGATEYAVDGQNALLVDTSNEEECYRAARRLVSDNELRRRIQDQAVGTAAEYSIRRAVVSEVTLFTQHWRQHREKTHRATPRGVHTEPPDYIKRRLRVRAIVPRSAGGRLAGSTHVRLALPLRHPSNRDRVDFDVATYDQTEISASDVIVVQRNALPRYEDARHLADDCRRIGTPLVCEIDDNLLALPDSHPEADSYRRQATALRLLLERADLVTVPTDELARSLAGLNERIRVIPNALDERQWFAGPCPTFSIPRKGEPLRILAMGTRTHTDDLEIVADAARRLRREFGRRVLFEVIGCVPAGFKTDWFRELKVPRSSTEYPDFVRWLRRRNGWQIGLAPLVPSAFNDAKSGLKFLDYAALGLAGVFSDAPAYRGVVSQLETGILTANTTDSWYEVLKLLIEDASLRANLASGAHRRVAGYHTLQGSARRWPEVYGELLPDLETITQPLRKDSSATAP